MKHQTSIALHEYWQSCHGRTGVPANAIRAVELTSLLPSLFLVDLDLSAGFTFRFCGAAIAMRYGRDLSNEGFLALWGPEDADTFRMQARSMALRGAGLVAGMIAETVGGGYTSFEMLLLPLAGENGTSGAIGSMVRVGGHEEKNRIRARILQQTLRSIRFLPGTAPNRSGQLPVARDINFGQSPAGRRYRHLTLVSDGGP